MIRISIPGAAGRMGRTLIAEIAAGKDVELSAAVEPPGHPALGQDAGLLAGIDALGVELTDDLEQMIAGADAVIDFTLPEVTATLAQHCAEKNVPLVIGTTGLSDEQSERVRSAARAIPIVWAPNMSVGVNVLCRLVSEATRLLAEQYDIEIVEAHHRHKVDAPSGTAIRLAQVVADASASLGSLDERACYGRRGIVGKRPPNEIGIHTVRGGEIPGEHTIMFCGTSDRVEITHRAANRSVFAQGAIRAVRWAISQAPGLYDMNDVLQIR